MPQRQLKEFTKKYDGRVAKLLSLGRDTLLKVDKYSYIKSFGFTKDDVPQLLQLAKDMQIYTFDYRDLPEDESMEFFGVIHARYALSELEVTEAKELFIDMIESYDDNNYDDWILDDFRVLMRPFRKNMFEFSVEMVEKEEYSVWTRLEYIGLIEDMLKAKEVELSDVNRFIVKILNNSDNALVNSTVISLCMDEKLVEHYELVKECFDRKAVDVAYIGDLEDVEISLGLREERETQKELVGVQKTLQDIGESMWDLLDDSGNEALSFVRSEPKIGRNDPCPCGSGKKHKKCCLNK